MKLQKILAIITLMLGGVGGSWAYAQQKPSSRLLPPMDHLEILQLYQEYTAAVDGVTSENAAWVFTSDGAFETRPGGRRTSGQKELQAMYGNIIKNRPGGVRHFLGNISIRPAPEGAKGSAYMITVDGRDPAARPSVTQSGRYEDTIVKTAEGWRFKERIFHFDVSLPITSQRP